MLKFEIHMGQEWTRNVDTHKRVKQHPPNTSTGLDPSLLLHAPPPSAAPPPSSSSLQLPPVINAVRTPPAPVASSPSTGSAPADICNSWTTWWERRRGPAWERATRLALFRVSTSHYHSSVSVSCFRALPGISLTLSRRVLSTHFKCAKLKKWKS